MKALFSLNKYLWKYRWRLLLGIAFVTVSKIFSIYPVQAIGKAFDAVGDSIKIYKAMSPGLEQDAFYNTITDQIVMYSLIVFGFAILTGIFLFFTRMTIIVMSRLIEYDIKNDIFIHYQVLNTSFYKKNNTGDLMNRISEDVSRVRMYFGPAIMYTINLVVLFALVISTMIEVNAMLTLYVLLPLPFLSVIIYYVSHIINKKSERVQFHLSQISTFVQEAFSGIRVIKAYNQQHSKEVFFEKELVDYRNISLELVKTNALFMPMMTLLIGLSTIITIYVGGKLAISGEITMGNIAEFVIYVNMLTWPVASLGWVTSLVQRAAASQERINEFLHSVPEISNTNNDEIEISGKIEFKDVQFTYPGTNATILDGVSFTIQPGESLAIIGRTGSGKSTIASLLTRLYDVTNGCIEVDGIDVRKINLNILRKSIGYVPQEVFLFSETIANNIAFGQRDLKVSRAVIEEAAKNAEVYENILDFPNRFDTKVGERGITLSGGQKQRISIARAIIGKPSILVFDDCLSAVDTETEKKIISNLKTVMENRSTIIISHRISSVTHCDKIIVLDEGKIVESGNHDSLLKQSGIYAELYQKQLLEEVSIEV
ncbi:MAG: ABC transporter ATP-binding protein [Flavobacteriales bacterium]|nr:ABC transporter ATP-binding protein [Flavobacteriales bacterium]